LYPSIRIAAEVAFPGGRVEEGDLDRATTALREASEEIGLAPAAVRVLSLLDDLPTWDNKMAVSPVVGYCGELDMATLVRNPQEVERIFAVPLRDLQDERKWETRPTEWMGQTYPQYFFDVTAYSNEKPGEAERLWGLSAYMVIGLLAVIPDTPAAFGRRVDALRALSLRASTPPLSML
jgi:8-oxo-dGTP pyrophosphatase MutT (NUDIX family)